MGDLIMWLRIEMLLHRKFWKTLHPNTRKLSILNPAPKHITHKSSLSIQQEETSGFTSREQVEDITN